MKILGVIPARYQSSRFPGKSLVIINGSSMIERVYHQAQKAVLLDEVIVATDDRRIFDHVQAFGGKAMMTSADHESGTDRCAEVARQMEEFEIVINIQGDEPFILPTQIDLLVKHLKFEANLDISTLAKKISDEEELFNPNVVKVVFDLNGKALYFSRHPIPYLKNADRKDWLLQGEHYKHIGMYGFKSSILKQLSTLKAGRYYRMESLEQLKWLENGYSIRVEMTDQETLGIDTPEDLDRALDYMRDREKGVD